MAPERFPFRALSHLEPVHDLAVLVDTVLKMVSKYSLISNKLRFFGHFRLVSPTFAEIVDRFLETAYKAWLPQLEQALTDQLWSLAEKYGKAVRSNPDSTISNINKLVECIKKASKIRNVLCHGSWGMPDEAGKSLPLFIDKRNIEKFETSIDIEYLRKVQRHVAELACNVIISVTDMGWQFPGSVRPGKAIL